MNKRLKSWLIGIISFFVLLFILFRLLVFFWINPIVDKILREAVSIYSDDLYQVTYDHLKIKPLEKKLSFEHVALSFDSARIKRDSVAHQHIYVKATAEEMEVAVGDIEDLLFHRYFQIRQLFLRTPRISLYHYQDTVNNIPQERFNAYDLIKNYFDSAHVQYVDISDASFTLHNVSARPFRDFSLEHINATIVNLVIDSATVHRNFSYPKADQFTMMVKNSRYTLPDSLYDVSIGQASFNPVLNTVVLDDVAFLPKYEKYQFAQSVGYRTDWMKGAVERIKMDGINLHRLVVDNVLDVKLVSLDHARLHIFTDLRVEKVRHEKTPLLGDAIHMVEVPFKFDTITIKNSAVLYEEQVPRAREAGQISFNHLYASIYNTTNIDSLCQKSAMEADVQAYFMNKSLLKVWFDFPLDSRSNRHRVRGHLDELPLETLNKMLEPTAFKSIQSGVAHSLDFEVEADNEKAVGKVSFEYTDLKIALLNQKEPEGAPKLKHKIGTVIANWFVVKTNNPEQDQPLREGMIYYPRNPEKSMVNYWGQALLSGLKVSVGIEKEPVLLSKMEEDSIPPPKEKKQGFLKRLFKKKH